MSRLRPMLTNAAPGAYVARGGTAYFMIYNAVKVRRGLIHGALHAHGESCAIGSYFRVNPRAGLPNELIDEVATVNDSMPFATERARRLQVLRWLRWRLREVGMPGFLKALTP